MMTPLKQELAETVRQHALMRKDAKTFVWLRCYDQNLLKKYDLGGGNLLILIGSFAILNFISKVYYLLHDDAELWTQTEVSEIEAEINSNQKLVGKALPPRVGLPKKNERQCFIDFAMDMDFPLLPSGQNKTRRVFGEMWDKFRNQLSHLALPGGGAVAFDYSNSSVNCSEIMERLEEIGERAFFVSDGSQHAYSDLVVRDMTKWIGWLQQEIEWREPSFSDRSIKRTIEWIQGQKK